MKMLKLWSLPLVLLSVLNLNCSTPVPNVPICISISDALGFCQYSIDNTSFYVDNDKQLYPKTNETWDTVKAKSVIVPPDSWSALKQYILTMCEKNNSCAQQIQIISDRFIQFDSTYLK